MSPFVDGRPQVTVGPQSRRGRIVAQGDKKSLLALDTKQSAVVTSLDNAALGRQLEAQGCTVVAEGEGITGTHPVGSGSHRRSMAAQRRRAQ